MVVLNQSFDPLMYDLSFMYTKRCDMTCPFCMYNSGPEVNDQLDLAALREWLSTVPVERISSFGAYGGEVNVDLTGWGKIFDLLPEGPSRFVITNGKWSQNPIDTKRFLDWCVKYGMHIVVSGTPFHRSHQNRPVLELLAKDQPNAITLKPLEENFHAMGRLEGRMKFSCSVKCRWWQRASRIAVQPDGTIIFQNCDGIYPVIGDIGEKFFVLDKRVKAMRGDLGFSSVCNHYR